MSEPHHPEDRPATGHSTAQTLSRTIEALEARIDTLISAQRQTGNEALMERLERQQTGISRSAPTIPAHPAVSRPAPTAVSSQTRQPTNQTEAAPVQSNPLHNADVLASVGTALAGLRHDLNRDFDDTIARSVADLRQEFQDLRQLAASSSHGDQLAKDLSRLAVNVEHLARHSAKAEIDAMRSELNSLRQLIERFEEPEKAPLHPDFSAMAARLADFDPDMVRNDLGGLSLRLDELRQAVDQLSASTPMDTVSQQLEHLLGKVDDLVQRPDRIESVVPERLALLDDRLDEITRAIVAVGSVTGRSGEQAALDRLEERLGEIAAQIGLFGENTAKGEDDTLPRIDDLARQLSDISARLETMDHSHVHDQLAQSLDGLAGRIDAMADSASREPGFPGDLLERLEAALNSANTAGFEESLQSGIEIIDERLETISRRIDDVMHAQSSLDEDGFTSLRQQIADLSQHLAAPDDGDATPFIAQSLEPRLAAIEDHLSSNSNAMVEAARQAAETVIEAYTAKSVQSQTQGTDLAILSELTGNLKQLAALSEQNDERMEHSFEALHNTLIKIANRLEHIDRPQEPAPQESAKAQHPDSADEHAQPVEISPDPVEAMADATVDTPVHSSKPSPVADGQTVDQTVSHEAIVETAAPVDDVASEETTHEEPEKKSLLAALGRKLKPGKKAPERVEPTDALPDVDNAPSIDPGADMAPFPDNTPIEPGAVTPDIQRIMEKVREAQAQAENEVEKESASAPRMSDKSDFIAAARRAAQAATAETQGTSRNARPDQEGKKGGFLKTHRRALILASALIVVSALSWPMLSQFIATSIDDVEVSAVTEPGNEQAGSSTLEATSPQASADLPLVRVTEDPDPVISDEASDISDNTTPLAAETAAPSRPADTDDTPSPGSTVPAGSAPVGSTATDDGTTTITDNRDDTGAVSGQPVQVDDDAIRTPTDTPFMADASAVISDIPGWVAPQALRDAAAEDDMLALHEIGSRLADGRGTQIDMAAAATWFARAAEKGFAPAQFRLANLYEKGTGVDRDIVTALGWYQAAAEAGNVNAMHNLAVLYAIGQATGDAPDYAQASLWFRQAADRGVRDSQFNLAILYAQGNGVPRDLVQSYVWFAIAARDGDSDAIEKRDQIAAALGADELDAAQEAATIWTLVPPAEAANSITIPDDWSLTDDTSTGSIDMQASIGKIQNILNKNGFDAGPVDGLMGARTLAAIKAFQTSVGQQATGRIDDALIRELIKRKD